GVFLEEKGENFVFDLKEDEVVPRVKDISLIDGVLKGAFGGDGYDDFAMGEEGVFLEEKGENFVFDLKEDEVVPRVEDISLIDGVLKGAFGDDGYDDFAMGE
nr:hypothetical protein [Tanacetum cinerariifolium]